MLRPGFCRRCSSSATGTALRGSCAMRDMSWLLGLRTYSFAARCACVTAQARMCCYMLTYAHAFDCWTSVATHCASEGAVGTQQMLLGCSAAAVWRNMCRALKMLFGEGRELGIATNPSMLNPLLVSPGQAGGSLYSTCGMCLCCGVQVTDSFGPSLAGGCIHIG